MLGSYLRMGISEGMQILVVGGAGYIGSHMVKRLVQDGHQVVVLDNLSTGHEEAARFGELVVGDLADRELLEQVFAHHAFAAVMHFGAYSQVAESIRDPAGYYRNNVANTLNLLDAMRGVGVDILVFSSTAAVYGEHRSDPLLEDHPVRPINPYGRSKRMVEEVLADYAAAYGLRAVALRYFNAAGADPEGELGECHDPETHLIPLLLRAAAGGNEVTIFGTDYPTPDGTCIRDYVHVWDLCTAHALALEYLMQGGNARGFSAFNLGNGQGFSVNEVVQSVERVTGLPVPLRYGARRPGDAAYLVADAHLAKDILGWLPQYANLDTIVCHAWIWEQRNCAGVR